MRRRISLLCGVLVIVAGCGSDAPPFDEVYRLGIDEYVGRYTPSSSETVDGINQYEFDTADGVMCLRGTPFRMATRDAGSENLFIFLQGGGACWDELCLAIEEAPAGIPERLGVLDPNEPANPFRDWNLAYLPYCDGSLFAGEVDYDDDGDGEIDRYHRGLRNLSAALDVAVRDFPDPARVVLAGSSGGGYGTIIATPLVRRMFPNAELLVVNDAGVGLGRGGDPEFLSHLLEQFNVQRFIPSSCRHCQDMEHVTPLIDWMLREDPNLRMGAISSYRDTVIGLLFLQVAPRRFEQDLDEQTARLADAHPTQYRRFLYEGAQHTVLLGSPDGFIGDGGLPDSIDLEMILGGLGIESEGVTVSSWIDQMVNDTGPWENLDGQP